MLNIQTKSTWPRLVNAFKDFAWANDPQWDDVQERFKRIGELQVQIEDGLRTLTTEEVLKRLRENDLPGAYVAEMSSIHTDPQVINNGSFVEFDGGAMGKLRQARLAPRFEGTPTSPPTQCARQRTYGGAEGARTRPMAR